MAQGMDIYESVVLNVSAEQVQVLLSIASNMPTPSNVELSVQEKCELAFDALLASYESTLDETDRAEDSTPVDAAELRRAVEEVTNPSIATEFVPPTGESKGSGGAPKLTWDQVIEAAPDNHYVEACQHGETELKSVNQMERDAICMVFSQLPAAQWDTEGAGVLIAQARVVLQKHGA